MDKQDSDSSRKTEISGGEIKTERDFVVGDKHIHYLPQPKSDTQLLSAFIGAGAVILAAFIIGIFFVQGQHPNPVAVTAPPRASSIEYNANAKNGAISFASGATEVEVQGELPANGLETYYVEVQEGQIIQISLSSNSKSAHVELLDTTGNLLPAQIGNPENTYWQVVIPLTGSYVIRVVSATASAIVNYSLTITIPVRIVFAIGTSSASVQGSTSDGRIVTYLLHANGGKTVKAKLLAPPNSAGITIYGLEDRKQLTSSETGATSFNGPLPVSQDYVIQVVPFGSSKLDFTLEIEVH